MSTAESLVFLPTPRDVVVIESINSLGGAYFTSAFLQHPKTGAGILVGGGRELIEIGQEKWSEFLGLVADAKEITKETGGGSWSRPQYESCPTDVFYDLGPADNRKEFLMFQLTGHQVVDEEPDEILRWLKGEQTIVQEIPAALVKLESAISDMEKELLSSRGPQKAISKEMRELLDAVDRMATSYY